jgi:hypothetical protein
VLGTLVGRSTVPPDALTDAVPDAGPEAGTVELDGPALVEGLLAAVVDAVVDVELPAAVVGVAVVADAVVDAVVGDAVVDDAVVSDAVVDAAAGAALVEDAVVGAAVVAAVVPDGVGVSVPSARASAVAAANAKNATSTIPNGSTTTRGAMRCAVPPGLPIVPPTLVLSQNSHRIRAGRQYPIAGAARIRRSSLINFTRI